MEFEWKRLRNHKPINRENHVKFMKEEEEEEEEERERKARGNQR